MEKAEIEILIKEDEAATALLLKRNLELICYDLHEPIAAARNLSRPACGLWREFAGSKHNM